MRLDEHDKDKLPMAVKLQKLSRYSYRTMVSVLLSMSVLYGQTTTRGSQSSAATPTMSGSSLETIYDPNTRTVKTLAPIPLEEPVDENEYIVGPNDILAIMIPGIVPNPTQIAVSPEGKLILPNVGEIDVRNRTLAEVKELIAKPFRVVKPSVALMYPRQFPVTVLGSVLFPGPFIATSVLRLDKIVAMANISPTVVPEELRKPPPPFSKRRILLRRRGEPERMLDLEKYYAFHSSLENPTLKEGDIVVVPPRDVEQRSVSVYGAVNAPNQFEYREGDSLAMLIVFAQGLMADAD